MQITTWSGTFAVIPMPLSKWRLSAERRTSERQQATLANGKCSPVRNVWFAVPWSRVAGRRMSGL